MAKIMKSGIEYTGGTGSGGAIPSGWGIAKQGVVTVNAPMSGSNIGQTQVSISDLGLNSVDNYRVLLELNDNVGADSYLVQKFWAYKSPDAKSFDVRVYATNDTLQSIKVAYVVVAKGFGGGEGGRLPDGGTTGQALIKNSSNDQDASWSDIPPGIPTGGLDGQVLQKQSDNDLDATWRYIQQVPNGGAVDQIIAKNSETNGDVKWVLDNGKKLMTEDYVVGQKEVIIPGATHPEVRIPAYDEYRSHAVFNAITNPGDNIYYVAIDKSIWQNPSNIWRFNNIDSSIITSNPIITWTELNQYTNGTKDFDIYDGDGVRLNKNIDSEFRYLIQAAPQPGDIIHVYIIITKVNGTTWLRNVPFTLQRGAIQHVPEQVIPAYQDPDTVETQDVLAHHVTKVVLDDLKLIDRGGLNKWGIAKYGTVAITGMTSSSYRGTAVDLSDLTIDTVNDYVILTQQSSEDSVNYGIETTWCRKVSNTQALVYAYSPAKESCYVDYVVFAKGYGGDSGGGSSIPAGYSPMQIEMVDSNGVTHTYEFLGKEITP